MSGIFAALWPLAVLPPYLFLSWRFLARLRRLGRFLDFPPGWAGYTARRAVGLVLGCLVWFCLTLAMSGGLGRLVQVSRRVSEASIVVAIDVSNSMLAQDADSTRLGQASKVARIVAATAPEVRLGLVAFKGAATTLCPATYDHAAFLDALGWAGPHSVDTPGTDLGAALEEAVLRPLKAPAERAATRLVLVMTDGQDTGGQAVAAAGLVQAAGAQVVFVGLGTERPVAARYPDGSAVLDAAGVPVELGLDQAALEMLAARAGGTYLRLADAGALPRLLEMVHELSGAVGSYRTTQVREDVAPVLALAALAFLAGALWCARPYQRREVRS